jgi:hypothetical protein
VDSFPMEPSGCVHVRFASIVFLLAPPEVQISKVVGVIRSLTILESLGTTGHLDCVIVSPQTSACNARPLWSKLLFLAEERTLMKDFLA